MHRHAAAFLLLTAPLLAQGSASTLSRLLDRADAVVIAVALEATDPDPSLHRWRFATVATVRGSAPPTFEVSEPAGRACGRALHGILPGNRFVLFLAGQPGQRFLLAGSRGNPRAAQDLVAHVKALSATPQSGRIELLGSALGSPHIRVRRDAILDLAAHGRLDSLPNPARNTLITELARALRTRDSALPALVTAAARLHLQGAIEPLVAACSEVRGSDLGPWFAAALPRFDHDLVAMAMREREPADRGASLRRVEVLGKLSGRIAGKTLQQLLDGRDRAVVTAAAAALLARGTPAAQLARRLPPGVIATAVERLERSPRFRNLFRSGRQQ